MTDVVKSDTNTRLWVAQGVLVAMLGGTGWLLNRAVDDVDKKVATLEMQVDESRRDRADLRLMFVKNDNGPVLTALKEDLRSLRSDFKELEKFIRERWTVERNRSR